MSSQRIKGQEVSLIITSSGDLEAELTDIKSCEFTPQFEIKEEGYLGETTNRTDEVYNGVKGSITMHIHSGDAFDFIQKVKDRAQRKTPDVQFNIGGIFVFPNGEIRTISVPDAHFGAVPISTNDRGDYTELKYEFAADDFSVTRE